MVAAAATATAAAAAAADDDDDDDTDFKGGFSFIGILQKVWIMQTLLFQTM